MSNDEFAAWMARNRLSIATAADALGISRRMVSYYRSGEQEVPRTVELACRAVENEAAHAAGGEK